MGADASLRNVMRIAGATTLETLAMRRRLIALHSPPQGKLVLCPRNCGIAWVFCPRPICVECNSDKLEWVQVSGPGKVFSFTVIREVVGHALRGFAPDIPYVTAWIDLDEGPRFCSNIIGCPIEAVKIGMGVEVVFEDTGQGITLPKFQPRSDRH